MFGQEKLNNNPMNNFNVIKCILLVNIFSYKFKILFNNITGLTTIEPLNLESVS